MRVLSVGEILWDVFPNKELSGGAALNFSANIVRLGSTAALITGVGCDDRGALARARAAELGVDTTFVQDVAEASTGVAHVTLSNDGEPHFEIPRPVAFDFVTLSPENREKLLALRPDWLYFGTLLQLQPHIESLTRNLATTLPSCRCFYDMNLRPRAWNLPLVERLCAMSTILKRNEAEARTLAALDKSTKAGVSLEAFCKHWSTKHMLECICVTQGADGCSIYRDGQLHSVAGYPAVVEDTIGAGDGSAAAFLYGCDQMWPLNAIGRFANAVGATIASRAGATPAWSLQECLELASIPPKRTIVSTRIRCSAMPRPLLYRFGYTFLAVLLSAVGAMAAKAQLSTYDEPYRPQLHFSPQRNWTNDPNGLVYFKGEYHLFFQYNPFGDHWGHMSWGHAVSSDLLHWHELPVAIPENDGLMIFTGSVVVDHENRSGLCNPHAECLVAIYTGSRESPQVHKQTQNVAVSQDDGRTWTPFAGNPVLDLQLGDFRDPSVSWNQQTNRWVMAVSLPKEHKVQFYASTDLKQWSHLSDFGPAGDVAGDWECPDLLQIPSAGAKQTIWALKVGLNPGSLQGGSGEQYFLGSFDGKGFSPSRERGSHGWTNYGKDDYCAISFNGLAQDRTPVLLGWMNNWEYAQKLPTAPWRGQMSLPRELTFVNDRGGLALRQQPVIEALRVKKPPVIFRSNADLQGIRKEMFLGPTEIHAQFRAEQEDAFGLRLYSDSTHWTEIGFDQARGEFYIDRTRSGNEVAPGFPAKTSAPLVKERPYDLQLIIDRSSVEAYAQDGTIAMTDLIYPPSQGNHIEVFSSHGKSVFVDGTIWELTSVWK